MIRAVPIVIELGLLIFCVIDCIQTDEFLIRNMQSKGLWLFLIIFVPLIGPIAWLVAGRPWQPSGARPVPWRATQTAGFPEYERPRASMGTAEIDDRLRREQERVDREFEQSLKQWEASLRERERKLEEGSG